MVNKNKAVLVCVIAIIVTFVGTFAVTSGLYMIMNIRSNKAVSKLFNDDKLTNSQINKYSEVKNVLKKNYYKGIKDETLLEGAIAGMADSLNDPYTVYYNKKQMKAFNEITEKSQDTYEGIGVQVTMDENGILTVVETFENSPALKAGIKNGDKIISVDGKDVTKIKDENVIIGMIKGPDSTKVKLNIYRPTERKELEIEVIRKKITVVLNISSKVLDNDIGYIKMMMFDAGINKNFQKELDELKKEDIKGLIIDLRNNPGGSYEGVVEIADMILPKGLIVYTEDKNKVVEKKYSDAERELGIPLAILVNGNSASASEILSGAVQDMKKGTIIGTKTFGKGLVQQVVSFDDGSGMKYTVSRYFTPNGICIHGKGIKPDLVVENDKKYETESISLIPKEDDKQLLKAQEVILDEMNKE